MKNHLVILSLILLIISGFILLVNHSKTQEGLNLYGKSALELGWTKSKKQQEQEALNRFADAQASMTNTGTGADSSSSTETDSSSSTGAGSRSRRAADSSSSTGTTTDDTGTKELTRTASKIVDRLIEKIYSTKNELESEGLLYDFDQAELFRKRESVWNYEWFTMIDKKPYSPYLITKTEKIENSKKVLENREKYLKELEEAIKTSTRASQTAQLKALLPRAKRRKNTQYLFVKMLETVQSILSWSTGDKQMKEILKNIVDKTKNYSWWENTIQAILRSIVRKADSSSSTGADSSSSTETGSEEIKKEKQQDLLDALGPGGASMGPRTGADSSSSTETGSSSSTETGSEKTKEEEQQDLLDFLGPGGASMGPRTGADSSSSTETGSSSSTETGSEKTKEEEQQDLLDFLGPGGASMGPRTGEGLEKKEGVKKAWWKNMNFLQDNGLGCRKKIIGTLPENQLTTKQKAAREKRKQILIDFTEFLQNNNDAAIKSIFNKTEEEIPNNILLDFLKKDDILNILYSKLLIKKINSWYQDSKNKASSQSQQQESGIPKRPRKIHPCLINKFMLLKDNIGFKIITADKTNNIINVDYDINKSQIENRIIAIQKGLDKGKSYLFDPLIVLGLLPKKRRDEILNEYSVATGTILDPEGFQGYASF